MTTTAADFAKWVRPFVAKCPELTILDAIMQAAIEYCERTKIATEVVQVITVANTPSYSLPITTGYEPQSIEYVKRNGYPLTPSDKRTTDTKPLMSSSEPREYYLGADQKLVFFPTPDDITTHDVSVVVAPGINAASVPDVLLLNRRYQAISAKACAILHDMVDVEWTNPAKATEESGIFEAAVAKENRNRLTGRGTKRLRVKTQTF